MPIGTSPPNIINSCVLRAHERECDRSCAGAQARSASDARVAIRRSARGEGCKKARRYNCAALKSDTLKNAVDVPQVIGRVEGVVDVCL